MTLSAEPDDLLQRIEPHDERFAPFLSVTQTLPDLVNR
jgi:hypothetical protein